MKVSRMPTWVTTTISLVVGLVAIAVLIADDADASWQLSSGTSALLGALAGGVAGWQVPSPYDKTGGTSVEK